MYDRGVKRLPVVDSGGLLAGIVTRIDVRSVFRWPDDQLRDEVMERLITGRFALNPEAFRRHRDLKHRYHYWPVESGALAPQLVDAVRHAEGVIDVRGRVSHPSEAPPRTAGHVCTRGRRSRHPFMRSAASRHEWSMQRLDWPHYHCAAGC